jgi:hypothetical protein
VTKTRRFYTISWGYHALPDFEVENQSTLTTTGSLDPPPGRRGFPEYPEKPRVVIGRRKKGPPPNDIELWSSYWFVSDRLKVLFQSVDPLAFAFQPCDVLVADGSASPVYWLCDVVRVLDAFDAQTTEQLRANRLKFPALRNARKLIFNEAVIGDAHIFRPTHWVGDVFCDQAVKDACKAAGMKGIRFVDYTPRRVTRA